MATAKKAAKGKSKAANAGTMTERTAPLAGKATKGKAAKKTRSR